MSSCVDKCFVNRNEDDVNPLVLSHYDYKQDFKNDENPPTIWNFKKCGPDDEFNAVFDINSNQKCVGTTPEKKNVDTTCFYMREINKIKHLFELTEDDVEKSCPITYACPENDFCDMTIDLHHDQCGENLENYQLDGEYLFNDFINRNLDRVADKCIKKNSVVDNQEKRPVQVDEPGKKKNTSENKQNKNTKKETESKSIKETNDIDENKLVKVDSSSKLDNTGSINLKKKKNKLKASKRSSKHCSGVESVVDNTKKEKENNMEYLYTYGEDYRGGISRGHKDCVDYWIPVPQDKGWISERYVKQVRDSILRDS